MTFISYAQNFEDVLLRRAFKDVEKGFYIDVGANDPSKDSVTKAFYDEGWRGINIEPIQEWFDKYQEERPEDITLQLAIGESEGRSDFYEVVGTGLSTMNASYAKRYAQDHNYEIKNYKVPTTRLTTVCEQYSEAEIHFLKIDVEGAELSVLKGLDLEKFRPRVIIIESTKPGTEEEYQFEDSILLTANYEYVMFDGINRFYVAKGYDEIKKRLTIPPNVFDNFILSGSGSSSFHVAIADARLSLQEEISQKDERLQENEILIGELHLSSDHLNQDFKRLDKEIQALYNSTSWRLTLPLRKSMKTVKWLFNMSSYLWHMLIRILMWVSQYLLIKLKAFVLNRPRLKVRIKYLLNKYPKLETKLRERAVASRFPIVGSIKAKEDVTLGEANYQLTPRALSVYKRISVVNMQQRSEKS